MFALDERVATVRLSDEELEPWVERARSGDVEAVDRLVRRMQGPIRAFCRRMMGDSHLGDDAAQETFVRMWRAMRRQEPSGRFLPWVFAIARNTCIELLRSEVRRPTPVESVPEQSDLSQETADLRRAVKEAIEGLAEPYRSTFLLRYSGLSYEEIAGIASCPVGTVRSRLHEARRLLGQHLAPIVFGDDLALGGGNER